MLENKHKHKKSVINLLSVGIDSIKKVDFCVLIRVLCFIWMKKITQHKKL
jgi:hypothetical protein